MFEHPAVPRASNCRRAAHNSIFFLFPTFFGVCRPTALILQTVSGFSYPAFGTSRAGPHCQRTSFEGTKKPIGWFTPRSTSRLSAALRCGGPRSYSPSPTCVNTFSSLFSPFFAFPPQHTESHGIQHQDYRLIPAVRAVAVFGSLIRLTTMLIVVFRDFQGWRRKLPHRRIRMRSGRWQDRGQCHRCPCCGNDPHDRTT